MLDSIKKFPNQISSAFKRFPVAVAFAFLATIAHICSNEITPRFFEYTPTSLWFALYPIAAILIALTVSLVQESRKSESQRPQVFAGLAWLAISVALALYYPEDKDYYKSIYIISTTYLIYTAIILAVFIAPFWKQKDEKAFWVFLHKTIKAFVIALCITGALAAAIEILIYGFVTLFDLNKFSGKPFLYVFYFCRNTVLPILFFAIMPSIDECHEEAPKSSKFATGVSRMFTGVFALYVLLLYAYIVKILVQWDMPRGTVTYLVSVSMILMFGLVTEMYPARFNPKAKAEHTLLKIFPYVCIPLVILMSVGIVRRVSDYGISELRIYVIALNIFFYAIIAILLVNKIHRKFRYISIVFCAALLVLTNGPLSALNVTRSVWFESIKTTLAEEGQSKLPLNNEETKEFLKNIKEKSPIVYSRIQVLRDRAKNELAEFFDVESIYPDYNSTYSTSSDKEKPRTLLDGSYSTDKVFDIPEGAKKMVKVDIKLKKGEFELRNDTLFFEVTPKGSDRPFHFVFPYKAKAPTVPCTPEQIERSRQRMGDSFDESKMICRDTTFKDDFIDATDGARIFKQTIHLDRKVADGDTTYNFRVKGFLFME